ncbi:MAG: hypothetical protein R3C15_19680 [Thermoleophilia bacterium]
MRLQQLVWHQPAAVTISLPFPPLLESWERSDHPAQQRLTTYQEKLRELTASALHDLAPPLALGLHAGGRPDIEAGCDLDNFLTPVVKALGGGNQFSIVWATRGRTDEPASLTLAPADALAFDPADAAQIQIDLTASSTKPAWKEQIAAALGDHETAATNEPIDLAIVFTASPARNWVSLWKPTIDALGGILGEGSRPRHPGDDRIRQLVLIRQSREDIGWATALTIYWKPSQLQPRHRPPQPLSLDAGEQPRRSSTVGPPFEPTPAVRLTGDEQLGETGMTVIDFWQWAFSDLRENVTRGLLAEYLVARAVGDHRPIRSAWDNFDVLTPTGIRVEVKASGYLQSWRQKALSPIRFDRLTGAEANDDGTYAPGRSIRADVFVFAIHTRKTPIATTRSTSTTGNSTSCPPASFGRLASARSVAFLKAQEPAQSAGADSPTQSPEPARSSVRREPGLQVEIR